ncbi:hypothetical protein J7F01_14915 [Streptomyces sp. ISL-22]|uniref:hypothetical protein n=1 Tax=unclassified Streptomyces TaxID=2593676 RepID=UPI001BE6DC3B|nr:MULTISPECIES: hypothetical protein [unclassified Streptomyces]MBT2421914.1 hypothetical protein [Streptomyces sp. ISL-24]MBT2433464.1 hypothetical protein [Streptomyces sp. ISL-22]
MNAQWTVAAAALLALLLTAAMAWSGRQQPGSSHRSRTRLNPAAYLRGLPVLLVAALVACAPSGRAPSQKEVRKLAGSQEAMQARLQAEKDIRALVNAFGTNTRLVHGLTVVQDTCVGGVARQYFFQDGDDQYKIRCWLTGTAYYTAPRSDLIDVLTSIEVEGERAGSLVPFDRDSLRYSLAYYRNDGKVDGQRILEPHLREPTLTLEWDHLYSSTQITEVEPCQSDDPPVYRCLREPEQATIRQLRERGMVFKLSISPREYYYVTKSGETK